MGHVVGPPGDHEEKNYLRFEAFKVFRAVALVSRPDHANGSYDQKCLVSTCEVNMGGMEEGGNQWLAILKNLTSY